MPKYDVYKTEGGYLLDVQADTLDNLNTRIVVPLRAENRAPLPIKRLNPIFEVNGQEHIMLTHFIGTVPARQLSDPIANLSENFSEITNALYMAFHGF